MIERRQPDSFIERAWRKLSGKKKTKAEEKEAREAKERNKVEAQEGKGAEVGTGEAYGGVIANKQDDGVIR